MYEKIVQTCLKNNRFKAFYISTTGKIFLGKKTTLHAFGGNLKEELIANVNLI
jgi:hypothetical protein